ncbi:MAG: hypothetical protein ACI83W_002166 [Marinoscillum sp.]|jgi:hypothetical protein
MDKHIVMKSLGLLCLVTTMLSSFLGCSKRKEGVLEIYDYQSFPAGEIHFRAVLFEDQDSYPEETEFTIKYTDRSYEKGFFWPNKSALDLGYTELDRVNGYFYSEEGLKYPGKNGNWRDLRPKEIDNGGGSGTGSGGNGACTSTYQGPEGDIQLDTFCKLAWAKRCLDGKPLNDPEVQSACQIYDQIREPGVVDCPYCK